MHPAPLRDALPDPTMLPGGSHPAAASHPATTPRAEAWPSLLIVDDDAEMLRTLVIFFERRGFQVAAASSHAEAKTLFARCKRWTMVIADYNLPDGNGTQLYRWLRAQGGESPPVLLVSGAPNCESLAGDADFLAKPFPLIALEARVRELLARGPRAED